MQIISHRGYWSNLNDRNTCVAFDKSFDLGFGTETDIRDFCGELVISHDPPQEIGLSARTFFELYRKYNSNLPLALNIKADGLQDVLASLLKKIEIDNYFVFDMAIPDALIYMQKGLKVFTRQSEYEKEPAFYESADGVWIDCFYSEWVTVDVIDKHLKNGKKVCLVSPELHKRQYEQFWTTLRSMNVVENDQLILCTDNPEKAREFFYGKD